MTARNCVLKCRTGTCSSLLPGNGIVALKRRAKYLIIEMSNTTLLIIHLGMTGKLGLFKKSSPPMVHDHIAWQLDNGLELRFNDVRRFGSVSLITKEQLLNP